MTGRPVAAPTMSGGVDGAPQVGADQQIGRHPGDLRSNRLGLDPTDLGQLGIEVALHPPGHVVVGLTVAQENQPVQAHPGLPPAGGPVEPDWSARSGTSASGKRTRGQSFQSRSSP